MDRHSKNQHEGTSNHSEDTNSMPDASAPVDTLVPKMQRFDKKVIIAIAAAVMLVIVAALAGYLYYVNQQANKADETQETAVTHFDSPAALIKEATASTSGNQLQTVTMDGLGGMSPQGFYTYSTAEYQAPGEQFKTKPFESTGSGYVGNSIAATADYKGFVDFLTKNKFNHLYSQNGDIGYISATERAVFVNYDLYDTDNMLCSVWHADASGTTLKNHIASIGCAKKSSYKDAAKALQPFFVAYTKANPTKDSSQLSFGNPISQDGADGYKSAILYQVDMSKITAEDSAESNTSFSGYYYVAPNSKDWVFFKSVKGALSCSDLNTDVLKKAFAGVKCS